MVHCRNVISISRVKYEEFEENVYKYKIQRGVYKCLASRNEIKAQNYFQISREMQEYWYEQMSLKFDAREGNLKLTISQHTKEFKQPNHKIRISNSKGMCQVSSFRGNYWCIDHSLVHRSAFNTDDRGNFKYMKNTVRSHLDLSNYLVID